MSTNEEIAELAELADNLQAASKLPMPFGFHVTQLANGLVEIRDRLRAMYVERANENPWETQP